MSILNDLMNAVTGNRWESDQHPAKFEKNQPRAFSTHSVYFARDGTLRRAAKEQPALKRELPPHLRRDHPREQKGQQEMSQQPIDTIKVGRVNASIFENTRSDNGETYYSVRISRAYQDQKSGEWKHTTSFSRDDLKDIGRIADIAASEIKQHQAPTQGMQQLHALKQQAAQDQPSTQPNISPSRDFPDR